jgi:hypothetical protein
MPSAKLRMAAKVNPGFCRRRRTPARRSWPKGISLSYALPPPFVPERIPPRRKWMYGIHRLIMCSNSVHDSAHGGADTHPQARQRAVFLEWARFARAQLGGCLGRTLDTSLPQDGPHRHFARRQAGSRHHRRLRHGVANSGIGRGPTYAASRSAIELEVFATRTDFAIPKNFRALISIQERSISYQASP